MGINLQKGGNINLAKEAPGLKVFNVGLGWDTNLYDTGGAFDLDASAAMLNAGNKLATEQGFVFYNNPSDTSGSIKHSGDNKTGEGHGDDEVVQVNLDTIPTDVNVIRFAVTIHEADVRNQNFGMVQNAYIRLFNPQTNDEVARYDLTEDFSAETCVVAGELYRHGADWKFRAVGAGFEGGLPAYVNSIQ